MNKIDKPDAYGTEEVSTTYCVIEHLKMIRNVITVYELMSLGTKVFGLTVGAAAFALVGFGHASPGTVNLSLIAASVIVFLLWLSDAHFRATKWAFIKLYDAVRHGKGQAYDMNPAPFKNDAGLMMRAFWAAPHPWLYIGIIAIVAVLIFMR